MPLRIGLPAGERLILRHKGTPTGALLAAMEPSHPRAYGASGDCLEDKHVVCFLVDGVATVGLTGQRDAAATV